MDENLDGYFERQSVQTKQHCAHGHRSPAREPRCHAALLDSQVPADLAERPGERPVPRRWPVLTMRAIAAHNLDSMTFIATSNLGHVRRPLSRGAERALHDDQDPHPAGAA